MNPQTYVSFTLSLIESSGLFGRVGRPKLFCWASAFHLPDGVISDGRIVVLSRDPGTDAWREHAGVLSAAQSRTIVELLQALGMPDQSPEVEGVVDTSDGWSHISLHTGIDGRHSQLAVSMHSSGFEGRDAARLRHLFRLLFDLAGYQGYDLSAYGAP
jgi:hypothetical protein